MSKISIIVPVYNAELYLPECLNSILCQSFHDFEVIIINDGSTDGSFSICEKFAEKDSRINLFSIHNSGVSCARNFGLEKATGEWITFIDSDDWVEADYLEVLLRQTTNDTDIVMGNFFFNGRKLKIGRCSREIIRKEDFPSYPQSLMVSDCSKADAIEIDVEILCAACGKLTRRSVIEYSDIRFDESLKLNEDGLFHLSCYLRAKDIVIINVPLYHYRILNTSSNRHYREDVIEQMNAWALGFNKVVDGLPKQIKEDFISLSNYRRYLNIINMFFYHEECKLDYHSKVALLSKTLKNYDYHIYKINSNLLFAKRVEMLLLRLRVVCLLIFFTKVKRIVKKHLRK